MPTQTQPEPEVTRHEDFKNVYISHVRAAVSFMDIRLVVGDADQVREKDGTISTVAVERIGLVMAPECARQIADGLARALAAYEKAFGKLRTVPQETEPAARPRPGITAH